MQRCRALALIAFAAVMGTAHARAQESDRVAQSRQHFERGVQLLVEEQWAQAVEELERARSLYPTASVHFNLGLAYRALGRPSQAIRAFERFLTAMDDRVSDARRAEVERYLSSLRASLGQLRLDILPNTAAVRVDDAPIPRGQTSLSLDPGAHQIEISAEGYQTVRREVTIDPGGESIFQVALERGNSPAMLQVTANVPNAVIRIDGETRGTGRVRLELPPGPHVVEAQAEGYQLARREVNLEAAQQQNLALALDQAQGGTVFESGWFWLGVGLVLLAGGAVTIGIVAAPPQDEEPIFGGLGVVNTGLEVASW